jgi:adenylate kinase
MDGEKEVPETDTPEKTRITEGVSNLIGATVSSIAESVKAVASTITDRIKSTTPDPDQVELTPEAVEPEAARTDEQRMLSGDAAIAPEAVPAPVAPKKRAATKKPNKRAAKTARKAAAKKTSKKASKSKGRTMAKKSKKKSVTKSIAGAAKKVVKKAKKAVKKVTKKKKKSKR